MLSAELETLLRLKPAQRQALERLGLRTAYDLLTRFPSRYETPRPIKPIGELAVGDEVTVFGTVTASETKKARRRQWPIAELTVADASGTIKAVWYRQAYMAKLAPVGTSVRLAGRVAQRANHSEKYLANPALAPAAETEVGLFADNAPTKPNQLTPIYPETRGLSSSWFEHATQKIIAKGALDEIADPLPPTILERYHLPGLKTALIWVHQPRRLADATAARKRFAFEEVLNIQLARGKLRRDYQARPSYRFAPERQAVESFVSRLPHPLTGAQRAAIEAGLKDFAANRPMLRLLEGDVGSGKTAVAAALAVAATRGGPQWSVAYMAPTEILARQHFASFIKYFESSPLAIGLLTGNECRKFPSKLNPRDSTKISRAQLLKWVAKGELPIVVGTQALIQKSVRFKNLALVIIDEQHRFGVEQRARLGRASERVPHILSMTATPIPRTLALTLYGDLDLTLLDELPPGRRRPITTIVPETERARAYEQIRHELKTGRQAFIICPRIDEPDPTKELALQVKSAKAETKRLREKIFPEFAIGLVHSKLKPKDKEAAMAEFVAGNTQILVATSVVEVGVNVPNATVIVIEGAERFGLAQLHQLRGRVLRSAHQPYCFLFPTAESRVGHRRLQALVEAKNGFELAELDLKMRGAGSLTGREQWGLSDVGMEALQNLKLVAAAREEAEGLLAEDPELVKHPELRARAAALEKTAHFE